MKNLTYIIKHDRQTILSLLVVLVVLGLIGYEIWSPREQQTVAKKSQNSTKESTKEAKYYDVPAKELHLQAFDPNTADSTVLLGLGLQPWQVRSIYKYRAAGGVYTCPEDFARLYGLSLKKYKELRPYIRISKDYRPAAETVHSPAIKPASSTPQHEEATRPDTYPKKMKPGETLALNSADTLSLQRVPGIGPYFARKVVRYRDRLGGFVSREQLLEIQDFPESALPYLSVDAASLRKLNINKATSEQLRNHPYVSFVMARAITNYRRLRGSIKSLDDLSLLPEFNKQTLAKLRPYIEY